MNTLAKSCAVKVPFAHSTRSGDLSLVTGDSYKSGRHQSE